MSDEIQEQNTFLLSWDMYGLEMCVDITPLLKEAEVIDAENIFELIKDPEANPPNEPMRKINRYITTSTLRARLNPQRNYEVYYIHTTPDITESSLSDGFKDAPQETVNLIRARGTVLYDGRTELKQVIS